MCIGIKWMHADYFIFFFSKNGVMNRGHLRQGTIPYSHKHLQINYLEIHIVFIL